MAKTYVLLLLFYSLDLTLSDIYQLNFIKKDNFNYNGEAYLNPFPKECTKILEDFANYASNFTLCSILHARPIRLCETCIDNYVQFRNKYQELQQTVVNGTSCGSLYMSQDRLNTIQQQHDSMLIIWNEGHCNSCFDWEKEGPVLKNNTKRFIKMFDDTMECITTNFIPGDDSVCEKCMSTYVELDEFYKSLSADSIGVDSVCMDIVDSMNTTRSIWSKNLNCCSLKETPEILFLCSAALISCLPIIFYLCVRFCGPMRDLPNVLKQSRFKQSFLREDRRQKREERSD